MPRFCGSSPSACKYAANACCGCPAAFITPPRIAHADAKRGSSASACSAICAACCILPTARYISASRTRNAASSLAVFAPLPSAQSPRSARLAPKGLRRSSAALRDRSDRRARPSRAKSQPLSDCPDPSPSPPAAIACANPPTTVKTAPPNRRSGTRLAPLAKAQSRSIRRAA